MALDFLGRNKDSCKTTFDRIDNFDSMMKDSGLNWTVRADKVFTENNFQSEIIWMYKRWSNSKKGLLNAHQNIYFYSKSKDFKFNQIYTNYSPSTNIDQILQERARNAKGKSEYRKDSNGNVIQVKNKKDV